MYVEINGIKIHYLTQGTRDPKKTSILFVPGIMMPAWIWEPQLTYFSQKYNVIAIEPRSHGNSTHAHEGHDAFSMAKDIQAIIEALDLEPLVLVGWSLGVPQVVNYAARLAGKGLLGLVLVDGIVGADPSLPFYQGMVDFWAQFESNRSTKTPQFIRTIFKQPQSEAYFGKLNDIAMKMPTDIVMNLMKNYIHQDFRPLLSKIKVPTYIATIEGPRLDYMKTMQRTIPNAQIEIFQSAGHTLFVDQADAFNRSLEAFIRFCTNS
jgi:microsomal epoxide hydrolase